MFTCRTFGAAAAETVKLATLADEPDGVVTAIFPVTAVAGTIAVILVSELTAKSVATAVPNWTFVAPVNPEPSSSTALPRAPLAGLKPVIFGVTLNEAVLAADPPGPPTATGPVTAPGGTVSFTCVALTWTSVATGVPAKV